MKHTINKLLCGSTRSGKTWAELKVLVQAALLGSIALVVIDPHRDSLAGPLIGHLVAHGMQRRILFDRLSDVDRVLSWDFLPPSTASNNLVRDAENESNIRAFIDVLCRRRQVETVATSPLVEEGLLDVLWLYVEQDRRVPLTDIQFALSPRHPKFRQLLDHCTNPEIVRKFRAIARARTSRSQHAAVIRFIRGVCSSPAFSVRCTAQPTLHLGNVLDKYGIVAAEGGGASLSDDAMRSMMGAIVLQVIRYVRTRPRPYPPVILAMDEATNAGLVGASGYETRALAECAKMGLFFHILIQQLNFPNAAITEAVLANTLVHEWYFNANPAVRRKASVDLGSRDYMNVIGSLKVGERMVKDRDRVYRDYVEPLVDPWGFEGLAKRKAERALVEIQKRPEYRTPTTRGRATNEAKAPNGNVIPEEENPQLGI